MMKQLKCHKAKDRPFTFDRARIVTLECPKDREFCVHASDQALPGESFWAMAHKFCARNALSWPEAVAAMSTGAEIDGAGRRLAGRMDPRHRPQGKWLPQFIETIRANAESIERGTIEGLSGSLVDKFGIDLLSARTLRFCPKCIEGGHHSITSQFIFQKRCAIHDVDLQNKCPACAREIPFKMPGAYDESFACPNCKAALWQRRAVTRTSSQVDLLADMQLRDVTERLRSWGRLEFELGVRKRLSWGTQLGERSRRDMPGERMARYLDQMTNTEGCSISASADTALAPAPDSPARLLSLIKPYYKAIARHLRKRVLRSGNKHVRSLCLADWRDRRYFEYRAQYKTADAPNEAYAYVSWRMLWEIVETPARLLAGGVEAASPRKTPNELRARDWEVAVYQQFVAHFRLAWVRPLSTETKARFDGRVFVMSCLDTFNRIVESYASSPRHGDISAWQDFEMHRATAPLFILAGTSPGGTKLHWFTEHPCVAA